MKLSAHAAMGEEDGARRLEDLQALAGLADATLDKLRAARSDDEIRTGVAELGRIMHDDPPAAFLAWQQTSRAVSTNFDVAAEENRDIFTSIWQWRPAAAAKASSR
jgi:hypothetical protein